MKKLKLELKDENTISLSEAEYNSIFNNKELVNKTEEEGIGVITSTKAMFKDFTIVKNSIIIDKSVYGSARFLYIYLLSLAFLKGSCYASYESMSGHLGYTRKTIYNILTVLKDAGWITAHRRGRGKPNVYRLEK